MKSRRGFSSPHGWRLSWLLSAVAKLTRRFGKDDEFNSSFARFFCLEITCGYIYQPANLALRTVFSSIMNRFLCHLYEESAGIYSPQRTVAFAFIFQKLQHLRELLESQPSISNAEALNIFYYVASLFLLTCASSKRARLVSLYKVIIDKREENLQALYQSSYPEDTALAEELEKIFPNDLNASCEDPLYPKLFQHFLRRKPLSKKAWVDELVKPLKTIEKFYPGISTAYRTLAPQWYSKKDRPVFTYPPIMMTYLTLECSSSDQIFPQFPNEISGLETFNRVAKLIQLHEDLTVEPLLAREVNTFVNEVLTISESFNWNDFVSSPGVQLPDVVKDIHTGEYGRNHTHFAQISSVVQDQEKILSEAQQLLLKAYTRCHILSDLPIESRKRLREPTSSLPTTSVISAPSVPKQKSISQLIATVAEDQIRSRFLQLPLMLDRELQSNECLRGQRATGLGKGIVYIIKDWEEGKFVVKSVASYGIAALVNLRTQIISLWRGSTPVPTHFFERTDGQLYFTMPNVADPSTFRHPGRSAEAFAMINEAGSSRYIVDKESQSLQEFSQFLKSASLTNHQSNRVIAEAALLFFYRYLLGVGDPALRNVLVRCSDHRVFVIDFEENSTRTDHPSIASPPQLGELLFGRIGGKIGRADAQKLESPCQHEISSLKESIQFVKSSLEPDGPFLKLIISLGYPATHFNIPRLLELCDIFILSVNQGLPKF